MGHSNSDYDIAYRTQYQPEGDDRLKISELVEFGVQGHQNGHSYAGA
jgi:hypothetical protein